MQGHVVTLFVRARSDSAARGVLETLGQLVRKKLVASFFEVPSGGGDSSSRFAGSVFNLGGEESCDALDDWRISEPLTS